MKAIAHTYTIEHICKIPTAILEYNGKLKQVKSVDHCELEEEIIRCRDCKFYDQNPRLPGCTQFDFGMSKDMSNGFCAWGERQ